MELVAVEKAQRSSGGAEGGKPREGGKKKDKEVALAHSGPGGVEESKSESEEEPAPRAPGRGSRSNRYDRV
jgi:hypothetical protein